MLGTGLQNERERYLVVSYKPVFNQVCTRIPKSKATAFLEMEKKKYCKVLERKSVDRARVDRVLKH